MMAMRPLQFILVAVISLVLLSGRGFPFRILNDRCEDFTSTPIAQQRACNDYLIADFGLTIWHGLMMRSAAYLRGGDIESARRGYAAAIGYILHNNWFSDDADWLGSVCWTYTVLNNVDAALPYCMDANKADPGNGTALLSRGLLELRTGDFQQAQRDFDTALRRTLSLQVTAELSVERRHYALFGRGLAKLRLGDTEGGKADIAAAEKFKPGVTAEFALYGLALS